MVVLVGAPTGFAPPQQVRYLPSAMFKHIVAGLLVVVGLVACGDPKVEIQVPLAVVNVAPHDGATSIELNAVPTVCFSQDMDTSLAAASLVLEEDGGGAVTGQTLSAAGSARCLSIAHDPLKADTAYLIRVKQGLKSAEGTELAADVASRFRTGR